MEQDIQQVDFQGQLDLITQILKSLTGVKFPLNNEKVLQASIEKRLKSRFIGYQREYELDEKNIPDFLIAGCVAVEVKIKGNAQLIYRQCWRYCQFDQVKSLILITNRSMGFPKEINGKPCYLLNLGKAWL